ncbi:MAG: hypothetical protein HY599_00255, partial [Candidatus Omnitrophica bacterium]|nr:hypothetical protein [Candidatus Omnitrophota bacterium]
QEPFWAWGFSAISGALYLSATSFAVLANRHRRDTSSLVMRDLARRNPEERVLLEATQIVWPLVLFPALRGSHSRSFTGRRWIPGIKAGFGLSRLYLTDKRLLAQLLVPPVLIFDIDREDVRSAGYVDRERDLVGVRYAAGRISPMTKLLAFTGLPASRDMVFLNLGADSQRWLNALTPAAST